jgi:GMP synthase-like glutamine amidotransferase
VKVHYLQHAPFEGLGSISVWLAARGARVSGTRLFAGEELPSAHDADWVIALGGPMSVNDEGTLPWLAAEKSFLHGAIQAGRTVLGICLGAQLIASALGARVAPGAHREVGWFPVERVEAAPGGARGSAPDAPDAPGAAAALLPRRFTAFHWHGESFELPRGAAHLARSAGCENQAFSVGPRVLGLQFHLETTPEAAAALCRSCPQDLEPGSYVQSREEMLAAAPSFREANRLMEDLLGRLAAVTG